MISTVNYTRRDDSGGHYTEGPVWMWVLMGGIALLWVAGIAYMILV